MINKSSKNEVNAVKKSERLAIVLTCAVILTACGGESAGNFSETAVPESSSTDENISVSYYDNIPKDASYDGYEFTVLSYDTGSWNVFITADVSRGDVMNSAAHKRNSEVEEMLDISVNELLLSRNDYESVYKQQVMAGDTEFDMCAHFSLGAFASYISENLVYDWGDVPNIDLSAPWYNKSANEAYSIAEKQYFAVSDFTFPVQQHARILFNKELFDKYQLDYPYEAVFAGEWTLDMMLKYCKDFYQDLDNDGNESLGDRYGMITSGGLFSVDPACACERAVRFDGDKLVLNLYSERIVDMIEDISDFYRNPDILMRTQPYATQYKIFEDGNALFETYSSDPALLRSIEAFDFGYLPFPKYDDTQEDYYSNTFGGLISIPNTVKDIERTGTIIEALSAASNKYMKDAFIEQYIEGKVLRDDESVEIYRMMRDNAVYELSFYIDPSGQCGSYYGTLMSENAPEISSHYASIEGAIKKGYEDLYKMVADNE